LRSCLIDPSRQIAENPSGDQQLGINLDTALSTYHLDAIVSATDNPAWVTDLIYRDHFIYGTSGLAGPEGYPIIQVPAGMPQLCALPTQPTNCTQYGVPLGISFFGTAFSEPTLIKLASGFEAATLARAHNLPTFAATAPFTHIQGTTLMRPSKRNVPFPPASYGERKRHHHM